VLRALRRADDAALPIGPNWLHGLARDITARCGATALTLLILLVAAYLLLQARRRAMWLMLVSSGGAPAVERSRRSRCGNTRSIGV
jgi:undecaprenyl-diphosphatase